MFPQKYEAFMIFVNIDNDNNKTYLLSSKSAY